MYKLRRPIRKLDYVLLNPQPLPPGPPDPDPRWIVPPHVNLGRSFAKQIF